MVTDVKSITNTLKAILGIDTDNFEQYYVTLLNLCALGEGHPRCPCLGYLYEICTFIFGTIRVCFQQILKKLVCAESKYVHLLSPAFGHKGYHQACKEILGLNPTAIEDNWMLVYQLAWWLVLLHEHADYQVNF
jgi:hypothetical protein